jgi:hypothetical protein
MVSLKYLHVFIVLLLFLNIGLVVGQDTTPPDEYGVPPEEFHRVGQSGWQFLKIPANARNAAIGGISTSLANGDANTMFHNPAELVGVQSIDVSANRVNWFAEIPVQSVGVAKNFDGIGVIGLSVLMVDYGDMKRTEYGLVGDPAAPSGQRNVVLDDLGTFTASDLAVGLSYARQVTDRLSVGTNIRYIQEKIDDLSMSNYSIDIGTMYYTGFKSLRLAMVARNFGPDRKLVDYNEEVQREPASIKMPVQFRLGAAIDFLEGDDSPHLLTAAVEGVHPNDGPEKLNVGLEYRLFEMFMARGGYRFNYDEEGITLGAGLNLDLGGANVIFDYAYIDFGHLDYVQMFSVGLTY